MPLWSAVTAPGGALASVLGAEGASLTSEQIFTRLLISMAVIILAARLLGAVATRFAQPRVMGEVLAGILLGPTLLGAVAPGIEAAVFPPEIVPLLAGAADIGLAFYLFLVGLELDPDVLRGRVKQAAIISNSSVAVPLLLGALIAIPLHEALAPSDVPLLPFALFIGVSMSITAFPVLARILVERRLLKRPLGALAMAAAAVDDVTAWGLLALATATAAAAAAAAETGGTASLQGPVLDVVRILGLTAVFVVVMIKGIRPLLARMATAFDQAGYVTIAWVSAVFIGVLVAAGVAGLIGITPIFGAFVMGLIMPRREALTRAVSGRLEDFVAIVLLPLFFAVAGLKANIFLINDASLVGVTIALILVAIGSKFLTAATAARITGMGGRESLAIGALMNTRGLTELIVLKVGLDIGVIGPELFTMLVVMALVTTFMAGPLLRVIDPSGKITKGPPVDELTSHAPPALDPAAAATRAVVVSAIDGKHVPDLLTLAATLARAEPVREVIAVRLVEPGAFTSGVNDLERRLAIANDELDAATAAWPMDRAPLRTAALASQRPGRDLVRLAGPDRVDLVLSDGRRPILGEGVLGGSIRPVLDEVACDVGILVRHREHALDLDPARPIVVPFGGAVHDWAALELAAWLAAGTGATVRMLGVPKTVDGAEDDPSRLLDNASVVLRQVTGVAVETRVADAASGGLLAQLDDSALLVVGLSSRWREEGLGTVRTNLANQAPTPVLFVRRGTRAGALAPPGDATTFRWSIVGSTGLGASPVAHDRPTGADADRDHGAIDAES